MKRRGPQRTEVLTRLFGDDWERWEVTDGRVRRMESAEPWPAHSVRTLAVPARQVLATPLWIEGSDAALAGEAAKLELEVRGLLSRSQGMAGVTLRLLAQGDRTLAVAAVFPPELPEAAPTADRFDVAPFLLRLPEDAVTLWREGEDLVAGFTRGAEVVYWESIERQASAGEIRIWLTLTVQRLLGEGVLSGPPRIVSWVEGLPAERVAPAGCLAGPAEGAVDTATQPTLERVRAEWKPVSAWAADRTRAQQERVRNLVLAVAAAYVVLAAGLFLYVGGLRWKQNRLAGEVAQLQAEVGTFQPVRREWEAIAATADPTQFPLSILQGVVTAMPPGNIHLTRFNLEPGRIIVEGESDSFAQATDFYNNLASNEGLAGIDWGGNRTPSVGATVTTFYAEGALPRSIP